MEKERNKEKRSEEKWNLSVDGLGHTAQHDEREKGRWQRYIHEGDESQNEKKVKIYDFR